MDYPSLQKNQALKELNLSHNDFGVEGGQKLGPAIGLFVALFILSIEHFSSLRILDKIRLNIMISISGANDIMESLDLSWNKLRRKGAIAVAKGVKASISLFSQRSQSYCQTFCWMT